MEFFVGTLMPFPYNYVPQGFMPCNGQVLQISNYNVLFALIYNRYGGDGRQTFALPNLNNAYGNQLAVMGQGSGPGLTPRQVADTAGYNTVTLNQNQLPAHTHAVALPKASGTASPTPVAGGVMVDPGAVGVFVANGAPPQVQLASNTVAPAGQNQPHENMQPYLQLIWCICTDGLWPTRPSS